MGKEVGEPSWVATFPICAEGARSFATHRAAWVALTVSDPHGPAARGSVILVLTSQMTTWRVREHTDCVSALRCPRTCSLPPFLAAHLGEAVTQVEVVGDRDNPSPGLGCARSLRSLGARGGCSGGLSFLLLWTHRGPCATMASAGGWTISTGDGGRVSLGWPRTTASTATAGLAQTPSGGFLATWWPCQPQGSTQVSPPWAGCCGPHSGRLRRAAAALSVLLSGSPSASLRRLYERDRGNTHVLKVGDLTWKAYLVLSLENGRSRHTNFCLETL